MSVNNRLLIPCLSILTLAASAFAQVASPSPDPASYGMTSGRLLATSAAVIGLIGVVLGGLALGRLLGASGRIGAIIAGLIAVIVGGLRVVTASGIGTGGGRAGAIIALVLGVIAIALGGFALARSRSSN
jgi:hypothetical protein